MVGVLQFEVLEHRLKTEYNAEIRRQQLPYRFVRWITKTPKAIEDLKLSSTSSLAKDARDRDVILFENEWSIRWALENNEGLELAETAIEAGDKRQGNAALFGGASKHLTLMRCFHSHLTILPERRASIWK